MLPAVVFKGGTMGRRSGRRGRSKRANGGPTLEYEFAFDWAIGNDMAAYQEFSFGDFAIDASRPCRVVAVRVNGCTTNSSAAAVAIAIFGSPTGTTTQQIVNRSRTVSMSMTPKSLGVRVPRFTQFSTPASNQLVFSMKAAFVKAGSAAIQSGVTIVITGSMYVQFQRRSIEHTLKSTMLYHTPETLSTKSIETIDDPQQQHTSPPGFVLL